MLVAAAYRPEPGAEGLPSLASSPLQGGLNSWSGRCALGYHPLRVGGGPTAGLMDEAKLSRPTEKRENIMADLIAIGYPDETTAERGGRRGPRLAQDLIIQPDAIAAIVRDKEGKYHVHTSHHPVGGGATWGMFWGLLFGVLFFVPVFGMAIGAGLGALMGKITKAGIDKAVPGAGPRHAQAGHLGAVPHGREGHAGQGRRGDEQVRRHRAEVLAVQGRARGTPGRPARRRKRQLNVLIYPHPPAGQPEG